MTRLTASELSLPDDVYAALVLVRDELDSACTGTPRPDWLRFDMELWGAVTRAGPVCGTAFCIGGSMCVHLAEPGPDEPADADWLPRWVAADQRLRELCDENPGLRALFLDYPRNPDEARLDPSLAVAAIDRFLGGTARDPWRVATPS